MGQSMGKGLLTLTPYIQWQLRWWLLRGKLFVPDAWQQSVSALIKTI
jgi:hypothetical protein